jgi:hypothetical protein
VVQFTNSNPELTAVDLAEGDIRLRLLPEASGQAVIGVTVLDAAGNSWLDTFTLIVDAIDDPPIVEEFQSLIPVERDTPTVIDLIWSDIDSTQISASTNRSWAFIDLADGTLTVTPPTSGFHTVLVSVCDQTGCTEREVDLEVMALADLTIEGIDFGTDELVQGDVISMRVLVRNQGQAEATMVSVRCETDDQLIDVQVIPMIQPGELRAVVCDWQIPDDAYVIRFNAVLDRGLEIPEGDEDNNAMEQLVAITEAESDAVASEGGVWNSAAIWVGLILASLGVLGFIAFSMPAKVKKIE